MGLKTFLGLKRPTRPEAPLPEASIRFSIGRPDHPFAAAVESALRTSLASDGDLPATVLGMTGMSGRKYRRFINDFMRRAQGIRYLEVGCYKGSTACAALYGNTAPATLIDDWTLDTRTAFFENFNSILPSRPDVTIIEKDFRRVAPEEVPAHDVYLFDGPHEEVDQYDGIKHFQRALRRQYLLIVDDWNWPRVREGSHRALADLGCSVDFSLEVRTSTDGTQPPIRGQRSDWHNGYFIAGITKAAA